MSTTKLVLDRQAIGKTFSFGTTSASGEGLVTINNGTAALTNVVLDVKGSQEIDGNLYVGGDLTIAGDINKETVTNLDVTDKVIRVNVGGSTASADDGGIEVEGDSAATIAAIRFDAALASKFSIGDGTTQREIVDVGSTQTLAGKTFTTPALGVASATSINKVAITAPATGSTLTIADGKTLTASNTLTFTGTDGSTLAIGTGGTLGTGAYATIADYVAKSAYDANTILAATADNTPVALTVGASTFVGRKASGDISAMSATEARTVLNVADGATANAKASGAELDTGTDDAKFATAKAIKDSHNVPSVAPGTSGNVLTSNGTDWISAAPTGTAAVFKAVAVTGTQDGSNKSFSIASAVTATSEQIFLNGQLLTPGATNDYEISGTTLTFQAAITAPAATDVIRAYGVY